MIPVLSQTTLRQKITKIGSTAVLALLGLSLVACSPTVPLKPAKYASSVECAEVIVRLSEDIGEFKRLDTNAQGTAAWGNPSSAIQVRCGLEMPVASDQLCTTVDGVDWLADGSDDPIYVFVSYGRDPAVEVIVDNEVVTGRTALDFISQAVKVLPQKHKCLSIGDLEQPKP